MTIVLVILIICLAVAAVSVGSRPRFGRLPQGARLDRIQASPNYKDGGFSNIMPTRTLLNGQGTLSILWQDFFHGAEGQRPAGPLPAVKTDLKMLDGSQDLLVWLGHSSFYIQLSGYKILVDPVFSRYAAPFSFLNKAFEGTDLYTAEDMPAIDLMLISHDHWDHLDYPSALALKDKVKRVAAPLGVGEHFERWGYSPEKIIEGDWHDEFKIGGQLRLLILPARHYSGRLFAKNKTLWGGFALLAPERRLFLSGDGGYGPHFADIGRALGGFDLAVMDGGQYDPRWPYIHMTPEEAVRAAHDVGAASLFPGHIGRFDIANHPWDEPFIRFTRAAQKNGTRLLTPRIGEPVHIGESNQNFVQWWKEVN